MIESPVDHAKSPSTWVKGECPLPDCCLTEDGPFASGGSGEVWRAVTPGGFPLVLKRVRLGESLAAEEERAMKLLPSLARHPHLLDIRDVRFLPGEIVIAMEEAESSLKVLLKARSGNGLPTGQLLQFMRDAAEGIDHLNLQGIQHRDIKPDNLLLLGGRVKVGDFGLAKVLERTRGSHSGPMTPAYAAPEWRLGESARHSDQYSLGVTYFHLRTGRLPVDLSLLPSAEVVALGKALSEDPAKRWPSCVAFIEKLETAFETVVLPDFTTPHTTRVIPTRQSLLDLFGKLNPRSQLGRLLGLVGMSVDHRPSEGLSYAQRVDQVLDWAESMPGGFESLEARLRDLISQQSPRP